MEREESLIGHKTMDLVLRIIRMVDCLPKETTAGIMGRAVVKSAAAAGIHYNEAGKARSAREFLRDLHLMQLQLNQTDFWLKMIETTKFFRSDKLSPLQSSNSELMKMVGKSLKTASDNQKKLALQRRTAKEKLVAKAVKV